jgi:hypothetical protein
VDIKGIRVDAEFGKSMIYVTNEDKPGFIGHFASLLGDARINIATFHLGRNNRAATPSRWSRSTARCRRTCSPRCRRCRRSNRPRPWHFKPVKF